MWPSVFFWCLHIFKQWFITLTHTARFLFWSPHVPMKEVLCQGGITPGCPNYSHMGPHQHRHTTPPLCVMEAGMEGVGLKCNIATLQIQANFYFLFNKTHVYTHYNAAVSNAECVYVFIDYHDWKQRRHLSMESFLCLFFLLTLSVLHTGI